MKKDYDEELYGYLPKVTTLLVPPTIGQFYIVPFYKGVPVYLPGHDDIEYFNIKVWHFHLDARFLDASDIFNKTLYPNALNNFYVIPTSDNKKDYSNIIWRVAKCYADRHVVNSSIGNYLNELHDGKKSPCGKCIHKSINLKDTIPDEFGVYTCPGHGMTFLKNGNDFMVVDVPRSQIGKRIYFFYQQHQIEKTPNEFVNFWIKNLTDVEKYQLAKDYKFSLNVLLRIFYKLIINKAVHFEHSVSQEIKNFKWQLRQK